MIDKKRIRNFAIIAHIDHGKSTLADRLIELCGTISNREMKNQILDSMDLERERGITIKAQTIRLNYNNLKERYIFNLIDTPGHVDFSYEVSRSLAACEGVLLLIDASQGVEAQTLANAWLAVESDLEIIPILNKVDLTSADVDKVKNQIKNMLGLETDGIIEVSAKTGFGVENLLEVIATKIPSPRGNSDGKVKALLVDARYDSYLGVMVLIRVFDGTLTKGLKIRFMNTNQDYKIEQVGCFDPNPTEKDSLSAGEVGYIVAGIKKIDDVKIGDTITALNSPIESPLTGFKPSVPVVFCGLFPQDSGDFNQLKDALAKLRLNDTSFHYDVESSTALGLGFRCGFLGLLHLEIVQERLEREFNIEMITTAPSVVYKVLLGNKKEIDIYNPADWPDSNSIEDIREPWIKATIFSPEEFLGGILKLLTERRGIQMEFSVVAKRAMLIYQIPLNEIVFDFHDRLKSVSRGYASFDYELSSYKPEDLVRVSILVNGEVVDSLSFIVHRTKAEKRGRMMCEKLKKLIPRQLYKIAIQAAIGGKIIARESLGALRKDVTAKCYGGDITRKKKLLEKQKAGKKRMRQVGNIDIPQEAFIAALKVD